MRGHDRTTHGLLIDLDGVIRDWPIAANSVIESRFGLPSGALLQTVFSQPALNDAVEGHLTFEAWREQITANLATAWLGCDVRGIAQAWSASAGEINPEMVDLVKRCRVRTRVVLVTNATTRLASDLERLGIAGLFDGIINSAEIGAAKPDPRIFQAALNMLSVSDSRVLFVDDSAENVKAAAAVGIAGHHFRDIPGLKFELLRRGFLEAE